MLSKLWQHKNVIAACMRLRLHAANVTLFARSVLLLWGGKDMQITFHHLTGIPCLDGAHG